MRKLDDIIYKKIQEKSKTDITRMIARTEIKVYDRFFIKTNDFWHILNESRDTYFWVNPLSSMKFNSKLYLVDIFGKSLLDSPNTISIIRNIVIYGKF